jgi:hypothetical protein
MGENSNSLPPLTPFDSRCPLLRRSAPSSSLSELALVRAIRLMSAGGRAEFPRKPRCDFLERCSAHHAALGVRLWLALRPVFSALAPVCCTLRLGAGCAPAGLPDGKDPLAALAGEPAIACLPMRPMNIYAGSDRGFFVFKRRLHDTDRCDKACTSILNSGEAHGVTVSRLRYDKPVHPAAIPLRCTVLLSRALILLGAITFEAVMIYESRSCTVWQVSRRDTRS